MSDIHKILDKGKPEQLLGFSQLDIDKSNLEMLVGMDVCQYRMMPCNTVLGDRSIIITNKRYKSKVHMLDVYKEAATSKKKKSKEAQDNKE